MEWIKTFLQTALLLGVSAALAPTNAKIRKTTLFVFSVLFLFALASGAEKEGAFDFLRFEIEEEGTAPSKEAWSEAYQAGVEEGICLDLCGKFDLEEKDVRVSVSLLWEKESVSLSSLTVFLSGTSIGKDIPSLVRYAEKNYQTKCEVTILGA